MAAEEIGLVDLVIIIFLFGNVQIAVTENGYQADLTCFFVNACQHFHIGKGSLSEIAVTGIYSKYGNSPVTASTEMAVQKDSRKEAYHQKQDFSEGMFLLPFFSWSFVNGTILSHGVSILLPVWIFLLLFCLCNGTVQFLLQCAFISIIIIQIQFFNLVRTQIIGITGRCGRPALFFSLLSGPHTVQLITFKRVFSVAQNVSSLTGSSGLYYIHCVCLIDQPPVIRPTGVARSYRNVIDGTAGFMYAADSAICCPSEEHDHMGIRSGADQNIAWLQFFAADAFSKSCQAAGSLIGETVPGHRPVNPADPAGAVQSL